MSDANVEAIRGAYEAFVRGDVGAVLECFDPGIEWIEPERPGLPWGGRHRGREAVAKEVFAPALERYEEFTMEPQHYVDAGRHVFVVGHYRGRTKAGATLDRPFAHLWELRDGLAVRMENHTGSARWEQLEPDDLGAWLEELGLVAY